MDNLDHYADVSCPICFSCFSEKENVPHMLKCGHTHCRVCLTNLMSTTENPKCCECRTAILCRNVLTLPINYSILRLVEALKSKENKHIEFKEMEGKLDSMIDKLFENQELYRSKLRDLQNKIEEMEIEKKELRLMKQNLSVKCKELDKAKSLNESLAIIKETMEKIKKINKQNSIINKRLKSGYELDRFQSIIDSPEDYFIKYNEQLGSSCFVLNKKLYMKSLQNRNPQLQKYEIQHAILAPFAVGAFLTVEYNKGRRRFLLEFELFKENQRSKQFSHTCLSAELGRSFVGAKIFGHKRVGMEGEQIVCGHRSEATQPKKGNPKEPKGTTGAGHVRAGFIAGVVGDKARQHMSQFRIFLEDWPRVETSLTFGRVVRGLPLLHAVVSNKYDAVVTDCGLVFDFTLRI